MWLPPLFVGKPAIEYNRPKQVNRCAGCLA